MKNLTIILGVALLLFGFVLVDHHRDIPYEVQAQRLQLLSVSSGITARIQPVGQLRVAAEKSQPTGMQIAAVEPAKPAKPVKADGQHVYKTACIACHATGIAGAPKLGDTGIWAERIAKGSDALYMSAIQGKKGAGGIMPPKGGNLALSDEDVKAAVDYMVAQSK